MLIWQACEALLIAYVPGALIYRLPIGDRTRRAALPAEERAFWGVVVSVLLSSTVALGLAAASRYRFDHLLWVDAGVAAAILLALRGRLRLGPEAPGPGLTALVPLVLCLAALWVIFRVPPAEYIVGGKDPGIYLNEGVQIAQHGALAVADRTVSSIPSSFRSLFFSPNADFGVRFMGFFLLDPMRGAVVGQFPHLYPTWVAIAYGVGGLTGARAVIGLWSVLGVLAVYFLGARIAGRSAAAAGAGLLAINIVQVWNGRYPNAELVLQPLVFASMLAYTRASMDSDGFFGPVAALLAVLGIFAHLTGFIAAAALAAAALLCAAYGRWPRLSFLVLIAAGFWLGIQYLAIYLPPYYLVPRGFLWSLDSTQVALIAAMGAVAVAALGMVGLLRRWGYVGWVQAGFVAVMWALAAYAMFVRSAGGSLAPHDADSLRHFTSFYLSPMALAAAVIGLAVLARALPASAAFLVTFSIFAVLFFYKIRIVPEHFWAARRFAAVILPGFLLLTGAAAFADVRFAAASRLATLNAGGFQAARRALGLLVVLAIGYGYWNATGAILHHVEYAGLIDHVDRISKTFGDDDLVLVESRGGSDVHVLGLPLAYIYNRSVLVLSSTSPDKSMFRAFLGWARTKYQRVFFIGSGGTELVSRSMTVVPISAEHFQVPEYESTVNAYPQGVRNKEFDLSVYELVPTDAEPGPFTLDVGGTDDLYVRRFHAKELNSTGFTFRWSRDVSFVSLLGITPEQRDVTIWASNGGRPVEAGPAEVSLFLNGVPLGSVVVGDEMTPYTFAIPVDLAATIAGGDEAAQLRVLTRTWNPAQLAGYPDARDLGVMVDRIEVR